MDALKDYGCVACWMEVGEWAAPEIHHLTDGGRRLGHRYTIPLCPWHHRGESATMVRASYARQLWGPSLARHPREFAERYGSENVLWQRVTMDIEGNGESG